MNPPEESFRPACFRPVLAQGSQKFTGNLRRPAARSGGAGELRTRRAPIERAHVHRELVQLAIQKIMAQRAPDGAEGELVPGNVVLLEQAHVQTFRSGSEVEIEEPGAEHHVYLVDVRQADDGVKGADV